MRRLQVMIIYFEYFQDVIENDNIHLDTMFKLSIVVDICQVRIRVLLFMSTLLFGNRL